MGKKLKIRIENCPQNHKCPAVNVCPVGALTQKEFEAPKIDYEKCIRCGKCSNFCPKQALFLDDDTEEQIKINLNRRKKF